MNWCIETSYCINILLKWISTAVKFCLTLKGNGLLADSLDSTTIMGNPAKKNGKWENILKKEKIRR